MGLTDNNWITSVTESTVEIQWTQERNENKYFNRDNYHRIDCNSTTYSSTNKNLLNIKEIRQLLLRQNEKKQTKEKKNPGPKSAKFSSKARKKWKTTKPITSINE